MPNIVQTTNRQVEILSHVQENPGKFNILDLEDQFNVGKATIERDLQQLREWGIAIHSVRGKLRIENSISVSKYVELLSMYIAFSSSQSVLQKSLMLISKHLKDKVLPTFVTINKAIEQRIVIQFSYLNVESKKIDQRILEPYGITFLDGRWLVVGSAKDRQDGLRHFLLENISAVRMTDKRFKPDKNFDISVYYKNVWGRFHDDKIYTVKIWFDPSIAHIIESRQWHTNQKIRKQKGGSLIFEAKVTGLYEIMNWILPWGKLARVKKPLALVNLIKEIATETLLLYQKY